MGAPWDILRNGLVKPPMQAGVWSTNNVSSRGNAYIKVDWNVHENEVRLDIIQQNFNISQLEELKDFINECISQLKS